MQAAVELGSSRMFVELMRLEPVVVVPRIQTPPWTFAKNSDLVKAWCNFFALSRNLAEIAWFAEASPEKRVAVVIHY